MVSLPNESNPLSTGRPRQVNTGRPQRETCDAKCSSELAEGSMAVPYTVRPYFRRADRVGENGMDMVSRASSCRI